MLASAADVKVWGWQVGQTFTTPISGTGTAGIPPQDTVLTLVGAYEVRPDPEYWVTSRLDGKSGTLVDVGTEQVPAVDDLVTVEGTFTRAWNQTQASMVMPLRRELVTLGNLDADPTGGCRLPAPTAPATGSRARSSRPRCRRSSTPSASVRDSCASSCRC